MVFSSKKSVIYDATIFFKYYISIYKYNFRVQPISEAIIEMDGNIEALVMVNVAADNDEMRDVILALMPRLHPALVKR